MGRTPRPRCQSLPPRRYPRRHQPRRVSVRESEGAISFSAGLDEKRDTVIAQTTNPMAAAASGGGGGGHVSFWPSRMPSNGSKRSWSSSKRSSRGSGRSVRFEVPRPGRRSKQALEQTVDLTTVEMSVLSDTEDEIAVDGYLDGATSPIRKSRRSNGSTLRVDNFQVCEPC